MANCRGCNAPLLWAITDEGNRAPLDVMPGAGGNVLVWRPPVEGATGDVPVRCATLAGEALAVLVGHGVPLRTNHFSTCPVADRFKAPA